MADGLAREGFDFDLRYGIVREAAIQAILRYGTVFECKAQDKCRVTGNLFVEFRQHDRPSGLATTTADYWVQEFWPGCWLIMPTRKLKMISRIVLKERGYKKGGDHNEFDGVIIPFSRILELLRIAEKID